jgi:hypothetical protein
MYSYFYRRFMEAVRFRGENYPASYSIEVDESYTPEDWEIIGKVFSDTRGIAGQVLVWVDNQIIGMTRAHYNRKRGIPNKTL